jgi:hypothetical protein
MNVTDLRQRLRRSPINQNKALTQMDRRKGSDRRVCSQNGEAASNHYQRIWLTPGERNLIEDLYLLSGEDPVAN